MPNKSQNAGLVKSTIHGTVWAYAATYSGKFLVFISTMILARLLTQEDFGLAGYALVVISFLEVFNDLGIGSAVIYHRDEPRVLNTAFWLNVATGIVLFGLTWLVAPFAGWFFQDERAVELTRVLGLTFPLTAVGNIHASLLRKNLSFQRKFVPDVTKSLGKGVVSIILALMGFGAWALVIGQVSGTAVAALVYWWASPWRPGFAFDRTAVRPLIGYGSNIVWNNGLSTFINQGDYLVVGRVLGAAALGIYTLAFRIPELLVKQFCNITGQVIFPAYTRIKDDTASLSQGFLVANKYLTMITVPVGLGLAAVAQPLVLVAFTDKWLEAVPVMSAISIYTLIRSLTFNVGNVYKAQGRPEILTRLSIFQVITILPALVAVTLIWRDITAVAWTQVLMSTIFGLVNLYVASRLLQTPLIRILATFLPALACGSVMLVVVLLAINAMSTALPIVQLVAGIAIGALVYTAMMMLFQREAMMQASTTLRMAFTKG